MEKTALRSLIESVLRDVAETQGIQLPGGVLPDDFPLMGSRSTLDSMAFVMLTAGLEQRLSEQEDITITIVSEKAMSMRHSPFRTMGTMTEYVDGLIREAATPCDRA